MKVSLFKTIFFSGLIFSSFHSLAESLDFNSLIIENEAAQSEFYKSLNIQQEASLEVLDPASNSVEVPVSQAIMTQEEIEIVDVRRDIASEQKKIKQQKQQQKNQKDLTQVKELKIMIPEKSQENFSLVMKKNSKSSNL